MVDTTALSQHEIRQLRAETTGTTGRIHFNNAGSSLPPDVVVDTVVNYLKEEAIFGGYETEEKYKTELEHTYDLIARLINANRDEIAVVENASIAWGLAFNGISFKEGDVVLTSEMEYVTNLIGFLNIHQTKGVEIKVIPNDDKGNFSLAEMERAITPQTKLVAITHVPSTAGGVLPIVEIGKIAKKHHILYMVDACQSAGQMPLDVKEINCDMLSVTGRKYLRAPRGTGFLFVKKEVQDKLRPSVSDGFSVQAITTNSFTLKSDARRFELYESSRALKLGLGKAVEYALTIGLDRIWQRVKQLASILRSQLGGIENITLHDAGDEQCGIVTFTIATVEVGSVKSKLSAQNINISIGMAKSTLLYMDKNHLSSVLRASVHYYNTEEEIALFCDAIKKITQEFTA
jgi:cysteine desulfurase/selenocysteine lyase